MRVNLALCHRLEGMVFLRQVIYIMDTASSPGGGIRVTKGLRLVSTLVLALGVVVVLNACGSSSSSSSTGSSSSSGSGTVTVLMGAPPDSLDPQAGYTSQSAEATWISYLGLLTYAHENGTGGGKVIPALATELPKVSDGGKTYAFTLRKGLVFSNGQPVVASDFAYTVERAIKIPWGGSGQFISANIVGGEAYSSGKAKTISGITTNDQTGQIVIHLNAPYGAFENVLAFPALGFVPAGTPMKKESVNVPPGRSIRDRARRPQRLLRSDQKPPLDTDADTGHSRRPCQCGRQGPVQSQHRG